MNWPIGKNSLSYDTPASRRAAAIGMRLLLASLSMLFFAGIGLYILLRLGIFGAGSNGRIHLPVALWLSTATLLAGSFTIHRAVANIRLERVPQFRTQLLTTLILAIVFLAIQFPCLWTILIQHRQAVQTEGLRLYGLVFCLVLLHALHVIGGIIALWVVTVRAMRDRYDHENYAGVKYAAAYWHFLDIIWIIMFLVFTVTG